MLVPEDNLEFMSTAVNAVEEAGEMFHIPKFPLFSPPLSLYAMQLGIHPAQLLREIEASNPRANKAASWLRGLETYTLWRHPPA